MKGSREGRTARPSGSLPGGRSGRLAGEKPCSAGAAGGFEVPIRKGLNTAVANSAALISTKLGMNLTALRPPGYDLDRMFMDQARENARANGGSVSVTDSIEEGYRGADFVYCKSWGNLAYFGKWEEEKKVREPYRHFIVDAEKTGKTNDAWVSHCLPMRRNVKMTDEVADSKKCAIIDEAENRLHGQRAILTHLLG